MERRAKKSLVSKEKPNNSLGYGEEEQRKTQQCMVGKEDQLC